MWLDLRGFVCAIATRRLLLLSFFTPCHRLEQGVVKATVRFEEVLRVVMQVQAQTNPGMYCSTQKKNVSFSHKHKLCVLLRDVNEKKSQSAANFARLAAARARVTAARLPRRHNTTL